MNTGSKSSTRAAETLPFVWLVLVLAAAIAIYGTGTFPSARFYPVASDEIDQRVGKPADYSFETAKGNYHLAAVTQREVDSNVSVAVPTVAIFSTSMVRSGRILGVCPDGGRLDTKGQTRKKR